MTIKTILDGRSGDIFSCTADMSVSDAVAILAEKRIGALPVLDGDRVAGIFSERDVLHCVREFGAAAMVKPVADVMTADVIAVDTSKSAIGALSLMTKRRIRHLPVVEDGQLVGFVSIGDLVKYRIDKIESEAAAMRDYINSA
ncbi:CBS domain-containing protein [Parasphingorhabdus marina DSM 22363]|uniref:CBS domain-containing protein n=1 Tax=Parasphingorhabdus marina DSM 22363 TaxID=1123272 RepID=A0A1N6HNC0_9SPHN|nr:CBS domain-containing protein [Parasphingorhabdus marina]SIO21348.1 CBS domain-containing protein [Parasphingorhabdus marina DSM 22363]